jgi:hypothetical protein
MVIVKKQGGGVGGLIYIYVYVYVMEIEGVDSIHL